MVIKAVFKLPIMCICAHFFVAHIHIACLDKKSCLHVSYWP